VSSYGFQVFDDQGNLQADDTLLLHYIRKTGTVQVSGGFGQANGITLNLGATYQSALIAFTGSSGYLIGYDLNGAWSAGVFRFLTNAPFGTSFNYYVLETSDKIPPLAVGQYGLEVYDDAGWVTFTSSQILAPVLNIIGSNFPSANAYYPGRTLGIAPLNFAGHNRYGDPDSGDTQSYYHDFAAAGGGISSDGTSAVYGDIVVENQEITGVRPPDANQFEIESSFFVLDLSHVAIGQTFF
jgi:hypothetical protein